MAAEAPSSPPGAPSNSTIPGNSTIPLNGSIWGDLPLNAGRSLQTDIIVCAVVTWTIGLTFVLLRFYTRFRLKRILGPTDWCIVPALLFSAGLSVSSIDQALKGAGKHAWDVDFRVLPGLEKAGWYGILFYNMSLVFTRISILLLYKRIFTYNWAKRAIQIVLVLVIALGIWFIASVCTTCVPLEAFWDWTLLMTSQVYCQPPNLWWGNAALHIASDLVIVALPMPALSKLNLPRKQKIALVLVFGMGFFVCIVSVLRLVTLIEIQTTRSLDATYTSAQIVFWSTVEVNASIACACTMTLKPLIQKWFPTLLSGNHDVRERSLRWITPLNTTRNSRQSYTRPGTNHQRAASDAQSRRGVPPLAPVDEKDATVCEVPGHTGVDLEAQRSMSVSTVVCEDDSSVVGMSALRAPPKAHLRLSIHVTKSVHVSKYPESPTPGEGASVDEKYVDREELVEDVAGHDHHHEGQRHATPSWQSETSTSAITKDFASMEESKERGRR
ncbi:hypothetical protein QBC47DRAFT_166668 [Echria macrotheca]|uniref:Rhodopsin domain-containing protein n=1 Tax=Echria macrotheca TaxID=438768 RepID=A0AAJ0F7F4_9PEZI|nr:hypothetical protein QBC47DRAFT_166668 [Echria macrotheca]